MHQQKFRQYYNQTLYPELVRMSRFRKRLLRLLFLAVLLLAGVIVFEIYLRVFLVTLLLLLGIGGYISYVVYQIRKFISTFKPNVVRLVLDFIDDGLLFGPMKYDPKKGISKKRFLQSGIFRPGPGMYQGEDYISGRVGDIHFEMSELLVREQSKVRARLNDVFRGLFIHARMLHPARGRLLVLPRKTMPLLIDSVRLFTASGAQCLDGQVHDEAFREIFTVYGTSDARLSSLLPKELMEFFVNYHPRTKGLYISIIGQHIFVAIATDKDILEPRLFQSNVSFQLVNEFYEDIYNALYVVLAIDRSH